jgi:nicotinamide-nucleotide amidase
MPKELLIRKSLTTKNKTLAIAESCTGGLVSHKLTNVSGSSQYFLLGITAYSNQAKIKVLKVPSSVLKRFGAVSKNTALLMAKGVQKLANSDYALSITGIAGPTGGTKTKPVGTVFIAYVSKRKTICKKFHFHGTRLSIKNQSAEAALDILLAEIRE